MVQLITGFWASMSRINNHKNTLIHQEDLPSASTEDKHSRMMNDASNLKHNRSGSESSDIHSISSDYKRWDWLLGLKDSTIRIQ